MKARLLALCFAIALTISAPAALGQGCVGLTLGGAYSGVLTCNGDDLSKGSLNINDSPGNINVVLARDRLWTDHEEKITYTRGNWNFEFQFSYRSGNKRRDSINVLGTSNHQAPPPVGSVFNYNLSITPGPDDEENTPLKDDKSETLGQDKFTATLTGTVHDPWFCLYSREIKHWNFNLDGNRPGQGGAPTPTSFSLTTPWAVLASSPSLAVFGTDAGALGINGSEQIVGSYFDSAGVEHGYLLSGGLLTPIDVPDAMGTVAFGINDLGQIVGQYLDSADVRHGYLLSGGVFTTIDVPGAGSAVAYGINGSGLIVGEYLDSAGARHGYLLSGGVFSTIDAPSGSDTGAFGINDLGQIVGSYEDDITGTSHGYLLNEGVFTPVDPPGATVCSSAIGIDTAGDIVGAFNDGIGGSQAYLLSGGNFTIIDANAGAWGAHGINSAGEIVGVYESLDANEYSFAYDSSGNLHLALPR